MLSSDDDQEASTRDVRRLLRSIRKPGKRDERAAKLREVLGARTTRDAVIQVVDLALRGSDPRYADIIRMVDIGAEPVKAVAPRLRLSMRHFHRLRTTAISAISATVDLLLQSATFSAMEPSVVALYARGRYLANRRTRASLRAASSCFSETMRREPAFAPGYVGLAESLMFTAPYERDPEASFIASANLLDRAFALGPTVEAFAVAGRLAFERDRDVDEARRKLGIAIERDANHVQANQFYAAIDLAQNFPSEAAAKTLRALQREPDSLLLQMTLAFTLVELGLTAEAIQQMEGVLDVDPRHAVTRYHLAAALAEHGRFDEALPHLEQVLRDDPRPCCTAAAGFVRARLGRTEDAKADLRALDDTESAALPQLRALVRAGLGDKGAAHTLSDAMEAGLLSICLKPLARAAM